MKKKRWYWICWEIAYYFNEVKKKNNRIWLVKPVLHPELMMIILKLKKKKKKKKDLLTIPKKKKKIFIWVEIAEKPKNKFCFDLSGKNLNKKVNIYIKDIINTF